MRKAQITTEFIFTIAIIVFAFIVILGITLNKSIELNKTSKELQQRDECMKVANILTYSFITGNNYTLKIKNQIVINPTTRTILVNNKTSCAIPISAVNQVSLTNKITIQKIGDYINAK